MRIVCLSAETADLCARLGAWEEVVAVSAFAEQGGLPPKPIATGFSRGLATNVLKFSPDLALGYSDVQAELAAELIRAGLNVLITNQRTLAETQDAIRLVARAIDRTEAGNRLVAEFSAEIECFRGSSTTPWRVYFEEWPDPTICGIAWVGEMIELLGAVDIFADRRGRSAKERVVTDAEIRERAPEVILASWCGRPVDRAALKQRLAGTPAVDAGRIHEIPGAEILQPGWRLLDGMRTMRTLFAG